MSLHHADIAGLIYESCLALDEDRHADYMRLYAPDFHYVVRTHSPEIRKDMVWLDANRPEMEHLFRMLPQHVRLLGRFSRHASVYRVRRDGATAAAITSLILTYTDPDGASRPFAVGRYYDEIRLCDDDPRIARREVRLETRDLSPGIHVPI